MLGRLGRGGMGRVYLGRSAGGRTVAVKLVHSHIAAEQRFRTRFAREVAAARLVGGEWTAPVLDADPEAEVPWVATGYVAGPDLARAVAAHGPLPERAARALGAGLAEGLAAVHARGLVHRDVKPSNVLLALDGPRLIDFGIARATEAGATTQLTTTGVSVGSPGYMSPEQALGEELGPATDVFSFGAVLAFAAGGRPPFPGSGVAQLLYRVVHEPPELDAVPEALRPLVAACLAKRPDDRPRPVEVARACAGEANAASLVGPGWLPGPLVEEVSRLAVGLLDLDAGGPAAGRAGPRDAFPDPRVATDAPRRGGAGRDGGDQTPPAPHAPAGPATPPAPGAHATPSGTFGAPSETSGPSGTFGPAGTSGPSGTSGPLGPSGTPGTPAPFGTSGPSGSSGTSELSETSRISAPFGTSGPSAPFGASAPPGTSGTSGPADTAGPAVPQAGTFGAPVPAPRNGSGEAEPPPRRRRSRGAVLAVVLAVLLLAGAGTAAFLLRGGEDEPDPQAVPQQYVGKWTGDIRMSGLSVGTMIVEVSEGRVGERVGTASSTDAIGLATCVDQLTLKAVAEDELTFQAELDSEHSTLSATCVPEPFEFVLRPAGEGEMTFNGYAEGNQTEGSLSLEEDEG
ncbi:protein kinase [Streptomyces sp. 3MP-14]|nr:protein kinase [Streptomyces sp. 3MP-14]